jgi:hypothetical protein
MLYLIVFLLTLLMYICIIITCAIVNKLRRKYIPNKIPIDATYMMSFVALGLAIYGALR